MLYNIMKPMLIQTKNKIKLKLQPLKSLALTCDCWVSGAQDSYMTFTCHFINENFELESLVLRTVDMAVSHTSPNLLEQIKLVLQEWGLDGKTLTFVSDNAADISHAIF
ncbi:unnamed protein product, partial [Meganyctiphanes norvegica]